MTQPGVTFAKTPLQRGPFGASRCQGVGCAMKASPTALPVPGYQRGSLMGLPQSGPQETQLCARLRQLRPNSRAVKPHPSPGIILTTVNIMCSHVALWVGKDRQTEEEAQRQSLEEERALKTSEKKARTRSPPGTSAFPPPAPRGV